MTYPPVAAAPLPLRGAPLADRRSRIRGGGRKGRALPPVGASAIGLDTL